MTSISVSNQAWIRDTGGGTIQYSTDLGSNWSALTFPATITRSGSSQVYVYFKSDILLNASNGGTNAYFICGSSNIQFGDQVLNSDGTRPTITINSVVAYPGLINNYNGTNGFSGVAVYNLNIVKAGSTTLATGAGAIGQIRFAALAISNFIVNCSSDIDVPAQCGGIVGDLAGSGTGSGSTPRLNIFSCSCTGNIAAGGGGIVAQNAGSSGGNVLISASWSSGSIGNSAGGIVGPFAGLNAGTVQVVSSYSTGAMTGASGANFGGGGIFGRGAGTGTGTATVVATGCYSTGIIGSKCGGIFGNSAAATCVASNCYTTGGISNLALNQAGGIFGAAFTVGAAATNCYTSGAVDGANTNGIYAASSTNGPTNYSEANAGSSGWKDVNAITVLTNVPPSFPGVGDQWASVAANTPYLIPNIGPSPYQLNIISDASGNIFITNYASTITAGNATNPAVISGYTFELIGAPAGITINLSSGAISAATTVNSGTYTLYVYSYINPYTITTYILTVNAAPANGSSSSLCCGTLAGQSNLDYATIFQVKGGNALIADANNPRNKFASYADMIRFKAALAFTT